tara:strand:- start:4479 stop:5741 length:1263 start_codon:yes stop_codon:yes gene_type:complete
MMSLKTYLLEEVQVLYGSNHSLKRDSVLIIDGYIKSFGEKARTSAQKLDIPRRMATHQLLAPCLVDPHSVLEDPINGKNETLSSLKKNAAKAGYGQIALLPKGKSWRDAPIHLQGFQSSSKEVLIHLLGSLTLKGEGKELSPHANLIGHGAIGIAEDNTIPSIPLLKKALLLGEIGHSPLLLAPRDMEIQGNGMVREGVETLRAGWPPDPVESEILPLCQLLQLHELHPKISMRIMNISTGSGVSLLSKSSSNLKASVCWWNLLYDNSNLDPSSIGWRVVPSIGTPGDRKSLIQGLANQKLIAVGVNSIALDDAETKRPTDQRLPGLSGYNLILPLLWKELILNSNWSIEKLWSALSFGPSQYLNCPEEYLSTNSNRWLLFDPNKRWVQSIDKTVSTFAANQPLEREKIIGKVVDCGLSY